MRRVVIGILAAIMLIGLIYGSWAIFDVDATGGAEGEDVTAVTPDGARAVAADGPPLADGEVPGTPVDGGVGDTRAQQPGGADAAADDAADGGATRQPSAGATNPDGSAAQRPASPGTGTGDNANAQDPAAIALRRASAAYEDVRALSADFVLRTENRLLRSTHVSRGTLFQRSPDRLLLRFTDPAGDRVVVDGTWIWTYYPSADAGQVLRARAGSGAGGVDLRAQFIGDPLARFQATHTGTESVAGREADVVRMVPRERDAPFRELKVWVDRADGLARRFEIVEGSGAVRRFDLANLRVNPTLEDALFRFEPPPGVRVVTVG